MAASASVACVVHVVLCWCLQANIQAIRQRNELLGSARRDAAG